MLLESRRFQQDVIIVTIRFGETEHGRIETRYPIQVLREKHSAGS